MLSLFFFLLLLSSFFSSFFACTCLLSAGLTFSAFQPKSPVHSFLVPSIRTHNKTQATFSTSRNEISRPLREHPPYPLAASEALSLNIIIPWGSEGKGLGKMHQSSVVYTTARAQPKLKKVIRVLLIGFAHSMDAFLRTVAIFPLNKL